MVSRAHSGLSLGSRIRAIAGVMLVLGAVWVLAFGGAAQAAAPPSASTTPAQTGTSPMPSSPDSSSQCPVDYSCQWANESYNGDFDNYATKYGDFADAKNDDGECQQEGYIGWNDCALSTYDAHTTCTADWYTNANYTGSLLPNTHESGSPDLYSTYEGDFAHQLSSVIAVTC